MQFGGSTYCYAIKTRLCNADTSILAEIPSRLFYRSTLDNKGAVSLCVYISSAIRTLRRDHNALTIVGFLSRVASGAASCRSFAFVKQHLTPCRSSSLFFARIVVDFFPSISLHTTDTFQRALDLDRNRGSAFIARRLPRCSINIA